MKVACRIKYGALSLGSIGISLVRDQIVDLTEEQLNNLDVKEAVQHNLLEIEGEVEFDETFIMTNISKSILSFDSINASLPPGESALTYSKDLKRNDIAEALYFDMITVTPYHMTENVDEEVVVTSEQETVIEENTEETVEEKPEKKTRKTKSTKVLVKKKRKPRKKKATTGRKRGRPPKSQETVTTFGNTESIQDIIKEETDE